MEDPGQWLRSAPTRGQGDSELNSDGTWMDEAGVSPTGVRGWGMEQEGVGLLGGQMRTEPGEKRL